ncbi:indole-3-butyric acid response 5 [Actinidia rufa]|uniref:Indole-3-butyric acid response 5 n=1 Tax=Actinidia rufa TaxID=165716 RepID=A0A7J0FLQ5_9ERIC|nr:indole-3-butyric acid response 5 [Actinidia rufa]
MGVLEVGWLCSQLREARRGRISWKAGTYRVFKRVAEGRCCPNEGGRFFELLVLHDGKRFLRIPAMKNWEVGVLLAGILRIRCEQNQQSWEVAEAIFGGCSGKSLLIKEVKTLEVQNGVDSIGEQCEKDRARVLVHCMSGKSRSPAIVIAYLMKSKGWRLGQGYQWVKERRPSVELTQAVYQQLQEYKQKIFGSIESSSPGLPVFQSSGVLSFGFGFPRPNDPVPVPAFNNLGTSSIFSNPNLDIPPREFTFGAGQNNSSAVPFGENPPNPNSNDISMDGS